MDYLNEFKNVYFDDLLITYKKAIDLGMLASVTDQRGRILYVNKKFCEISGFSSSELLGQNHRIVNSEHHAKEFFSNLWATVRSGNIWFGEIKNKSKNGRCYWIDAIILPIGTSKNIQYVSLTKEITERKEQESKKEEHIKELENLFLNPDLKVNITKLTLLELQNRFK